MRDRSVLQVQVTGQADTQFMHVEAPKRAIGNVVRAEREIMVRGEKIGRILVEMDDARSQQELREKQLSYVFVLAAQLTVSLLLIVLFLNQRLLKPLRKLMRFSDRLSHGDFETRMELSGSDELGRLAGQLDQMRVAIKRPARRALPHHRDPGAGRRVPFPSRRPDRLRVGCHRRNLRLLGGPIHAQHHPRLGQPDLPGRPQAAAPRGGAGNPGRQAVRNRIPYPGLHRHRTLGGRERAAAGGGGGQFAVGGRHYLRHQPAQAQ
jgi:HAMP domain-containing protein